VLVAEDNKINRKVMQRMLDPLGLQHVDIVENGKRRSIVKLANDTT
jgi:CheY-like chemotaxis protein